jgi:hypothetical protein
MLHEPVISAAVTFAALAIWFYIIGRRGVRALKLGGRDGSDKAAYSTFWFVASLGLIVPFCTGVALRAWLDHNQWTVISLRETAELLLATYDLLPALAIPHVILGVWGLYVVAMHVPVSKPFDIISLGGFAGVVTAFSLGLAYADWTFLSDLNTGSHSMMAFLMFFFLVGSPETFKFLARAAALGLLVGYAAGAMIAAMKYYFNSRNLGLRS